MPTALCCAGATGGKTTGLRPKVLLILAIAGIYTGVVCSAVRRRAAARAQAPEEL